MVLAFLLVVTGFLIFAPPAFAVTITVSNIPSTITDSDFTVNVSVSGASAGTNYLRIDLYKDGTTNYFGQTYNGSSWYSGSDGKQFLPITIISGQTWTGSIQGQIGSPTSTEYPGSGTYKLKIRRYTSSGNAASSDQQIPQDVSLVTSSSSPSPTPSSSSSSTFTISNTPSQINSTDTFQTNVSLNLPDNPNTKFYIKGAFKKADSSNYFGLTKVNSSWVNNSNTYSDQYQITTNSSGNWSGTLEIQPDVFDSGYDGSADYIFKVGRYSDSGSGPSWSNEVSLKINAKEISDYDDLTLTAITVQSPPPKGEVLSQSKESDIPEEVYSLENYRKLSTQSGTPSSIPRNIEVKGDRDYSPMVVFAGVSCIIGSLLLVYKKVQSGVES